MQYITFCLALCILLANTVVSPVSVYAMESTANSNAESNGAVADQPVIIPDTVPAAITPDPAPLAPQITAPPVPVPSEEKSTISKTDAPIVAPAEVAATVLVSQPTIVVQPDVPANADAIVSAIKISAGKSITALEFRNTTTKPLFVDDWRIEILQFDDIDDQVCEIDLRGYILAGRSVTFAVPGESVVNDGVYTIDACQRMQTAGGVMVRVYQGATVVEEVRPGAAVGQYERGGFNAPNRKGVFTTDFKTFTRAFLTSMMYEPNITNDIQIVELNANPNPCLPASEDSACYDYVKLHNPTTQAIQLDSYRLRTGQISQNSTSSNTYPLSGVIAPGETIVVARSADGTRLSLPNSAGTAWLQDVHGVIDYPSGVTPYEKGDLVSTAGKSWAYDASDGQWKWGVSSPYGQNTFVSDEPGTGSVKAAESTLKPCREDQYRSEETNRCRNVSSASTGNLTPCKNGQYRSEETNRCRNIALAGGTLKPCREDQYRSEETNRCRNVATASANLKPCKDNQYRSEETNRCRNMTASAVPAAAYAVQPVKDSAKAFIGWWALGGIVMLAIGYAAWEWRSEVAGFVRKFSVIGRRK